NLDGCGSPTRSATRRRGRRRRGALSSRDEGRSRVRSAQIEEQADDAAGPALMLESIGAALASFVVLAAVFVPLERLFPARRQRTLRKSLALDACFFFGQYFVWNAVAFAVLAWL